MNNKRQLYGLIGYPIGHSQSPRLFKQYSPLKEYADYHLFPIRTLNELPCIIETYHPLGLNITSPYKEAILLSFEDIQMSPEVIEIGACNTLSLKYDGDRLSSIAAYNTDVFGFKESLHKLLSDYDRLPAIILGTGGAARAVALSLKKLGYHPSDITFISRNPQEAETKLLKLNPKDIYQVISYTQLDKILIEPSIVINASPMGLGSSAAPEINYSKLSDKHICYDLIYSDIETPFLQQAQLYGAKCKNGAEMLRLQAEAAWTIWNNNFPSLL